MELDSALLYTHYVYLLYYFLYNIYIYIYIYFFFFFLALYEPIWEPVIPHLYLETSAGRIYLYCNILQIFLLTINIDIPYL